MNAAPSGREARPSGSLIAEADRDFDFGAVIATAGRKMTHAYHLVNRAGHAVKILNVINHKTCCGVVRAKAGLLAPGTSSEPPVDLDRVQLQSTAKVEWVSTKEDSPSDEGLEVQSRRFVALLDASGTPGERRAEILLKRGDEVLDRETVSWEVASPLAASPKVIVLKPGQHGYRVVLSSRDRKPFRVTRVECKGSGLTGRAASAAPALTQTLEVNGTPRPGTKKGAVTVFTNRPAQPRLDVPFVVLD